MVSVSTENNTANITISQDLSQYYTNKAKQWAISTDIVDNEDYSSKYYAQKSEESANKVEDYLTQINDTAADALENISTAMEERLTEINEAVQELLDEINSELDDLLGEGEENE